MLKKIGLAFGVIIRFWSAWRATSRRSRPDGKLLGIFAVNGAHNLVHIATGAIALVIALASPASLSLFFKIFGVVYGLVAVLGYFAGDQPLLGIIAHNHGRHVAARRGRRAVAVARVRHEGRLARAA